jgi:VIT1/CCC1 family predicted Fe2+/Mn2+ transporter
MQPKTLTYIRNFIFGAEDSLVSTVGLLAGIAAGGQNQKDIIMTGVVLILVEGLSMGVGSYLSEYTTEESHATESEAFHTSWTAALIMFVSYIILGLIPLAPFVFIADTTNAMIVSVIASLISLGVLGVISGHFLKTHKVRGMLRMFILGGLAIGVGLVIGLRFHE